MAPGERLDGPVGHQLVHVDEFPDGGPVLLVGCRRGHVDHGGQVARVIFLLVRAQLQPHVRIIGHPCQLVEVAGGVGEVLRQHPFSVGLAHDVDPEGLTVDGHPRQRGSGCGDAGRLVQPVDEWLVHEGVVPRRVAEREPIDIEHHQVIDELVGLDTEPGLLVQRLGLSPSLLEPEPHVVDRDTVDRQTHRHAVVGGRVEKREALVADLELHLVQHRLVEHLLRQDRERRQRRGRRWARRRFGSCRLRRLDRGARTGRGLRRLDRVVRRCRGHRCLGRGSALGPAGGGQHARAQNERRPADPPGHGATSPTGSSSFGPSSGSTGRSTGRLVSMRASTLVCFRA